MTAWIGLWAVLASDPAVADSKATRISAKAASSMVRSHVASMEDDHSGARVVRVGKVRLGGYVGKSRDVRTWKADTRWRAPGFSKGTTSTITGTVDMRSTLPRGQDRITDSLSRWLSAPPPNP